MKKSLLVSTLAVAFCAIVALAGTHKVKKIMVDNIQKSTTVKSLKSLSKAGEAADETPNLQVLLEEDFSKFTAGSEATPDATDVADATTGYIADELTNTPGWSGDGVFQAGGCAYIGIVDEGTDNEDTGFLNTSTFDGSGNGGYIVVTFRARVAEEGATDAVEFVSIDEDDINESDPMSGVVDYKQVAITDQWAEYEVELKSGAANASIQLYAYQSPIYIDDIKVTQTVKIDVPAPEALAATNVTPTSFTANWQSVPQATAYAVYTILTHTAQADNEPFNLFKSDFSAVKVGTIDSPWDYSRLGGIRVFLDDLAPRCDWIAFAPMAAQGMFGISNMFLDYNVPGTIYSPILDLGHDGGKSTLRFNVLGRNVTKLRICVLKDRADGKADELFKTECPVTTDLAEQVITLEKGEKDTYVEISIAEGTGYVLFDDLQLSQNLNKGESTELKYKYDETSDTSRRIDTPDYSAGDVYAYTVQAFRLDSSSKIIEEATSDRSEPQEVKRSDAVESITAGNDGATVATTADGIRITLAEAAPVAVYSLDGRLLHQDNTAATEHNVALGNHGIFLVRIGAKTIKVVR